MAELALAIIPLGIKVCSGLVSYLNGIKDRSDALAGLTRRAESLEGNFRLLDSFLKRGQLEPSCHQAACQVIVCLKNCEVGLNELIEFEQSQKAQNRLEHGLKKLCYPLRQAHLEQLEATLDRLAQPLSLAIQNLQLEINVVNSGNLRQATAKAQRTTDAVSSLQTAVNDLTAPMNSIHSQLPSLQNSVNAFIPQIIPQLELIIQSQLRAQMEEIRKSLQEVESTAVQRHNKPSTILSQLVTPDDNQATVVRKLASKPSTLAELTSTTLTCFCHARRSNTSRTFRFGSLYLRENVVTDMPHQVNCDFYVANVTPSRRRTILFTGIVRLLKSAIQLITLGTPIALTDSSGRLAFDYIATQLVISASTLEKLYVDDISPNLDLPWPLGISLEKLAGYTSGSPIIADVLLGPLTQAVVRCDTKKVKQLVDECPEYLEETCFPNASPLFIAVEKPEILELIVTRASPRQLTEKAFFAYGIMTPLRTAIKLSSAICKSQENDTGPKCPCVAAVRILLDANCPIIPADDFYEYHSASAHCKTLVSEGLRIRRRELDEIARRNLSKAEYSSFGKSKGELDFFAAEMYRRLCQKRLISFGHLSPVRWIDETEHEPLYLFLKNPEDAQIFFNLGFHDIDRSCVSSPGNSYHVIVSLGTITPEYAMWLQKQCPCFWEWTCQHSHLEGSDMILADITGRHVYRQSLLRNQGDFRLCLATVTKSLKNEAKDKYSCICAPTGYSPFDLIARWLMKVSGSLEPNGLVRSLLEGCGKVLQLDQLTCIVRQATFQALEISHTCFAQAKLNLGGHHKIWSSDLMFCDEDLDASMDDHQRSLYLNEIVTEFEDFMRGQSKCVNDTALDDATSLGLQEERAIDYRRALVFWDDIWPDRVREIKRELEASWNPNMEVLNDLGVSLWYKEESNDSVPETAEERLNQAFDRFMENLEKI
ncbi:hypothetical protein ACLX1H_005060 [Fusarium chlamydosporum]